MATLISPPHVLASPRKAGKIGIAGHSGGANPTAATTQLEVNRLSRHISPTMFRKRTLFILGAGASCEFGLPPGAVLASAIAKAVNVRMNRGAVEESEGADLVEQVIQKERPKTNDYLKAFWLIRDGVQLASSIDDFLDVHAKNPYATHAGKMAIVKCVLEEERKSKLYLDKSNIYNKLSITKIENTWIVKFMRVLVRGLPVEKKEELFNNVAFIVFNYDRCLEHFLAHAIRQVYGTDENTAAAILSKLTIIHPYGVAAPFKAMNGSQGYYFAAEQHGFTPDYWTLAQSVRTYTEQMSDQSELDKIHNAMAWADRIVFLGFAFHDQNMELLRRPEGLELKNIFATAKGMSESDVDVVRAQLTRFFTPNAQMVVNAGNSIQIRSDLTCSELFDSYNKSLPS